MQSEKDLKRLIYMKTHDPKGLLTIILSVVIVFAAAVLYEHGVINEDLYMKLILASKNEITAGDSPLEVHFIDVDQAECILIKAPEKAVLIDAGDIGYEKKIENYLRTNGVHHIDIFITTHPHSDHIGSASGIIGKFPVSEVIMPEIPEEFLPTTSVYEDFLLTLAESECGVSYAEPGTVFELGEGAVLEIFGPSDYYGDNLNNYSVISKLSFGEISFLFTGDAEEEIEFSLVDSGADISCTVLNAGHHGSSTSNSALFVKTADPEYTVISCGYDNDYGHPHREVIALFTELGIKYYRTDYDGDIVFGTNGKTINVTAKD